MDEDVLVFVNSPPSPKAIYYTLHTTRQFWWQPRGGVVEYCPRVIALMPRVGGWRWVTATAAPAALAAPPTIGNGIFVAQIRLICQ